MFPPKLGFGTQKKDPQLSPKIRPKLQKRTPISPRIRPKFRNAFAKPPQISATSAMGICSPAKEHWEWRVSHRSIRKPRAVLRFSPDNRNETKKNTCFSPWFLIRLPKKKSAEKNAMSSFLWFQCGARGAASATTVRISRLTPFGRATSCWASWECGECEASLASYRKPGKKTKNGALVRVGTKRTTHVLSGINPFNDLRRLV